MDIPKHFNTGKLYSGKSIINKIGLRHFQDFLAIGRLVWVSDNTEGNKLYKFII